MRNIADNPYINFRAESVRAHTLNSFLFSDNAVGKKVDSEYFLMSVWDLLSMLRFDFQLCGFKYLSRLVKHYLIDRKYSEARAVSAVADYYGASDEFVKACIVDSIVLNKDFVRLASRYLNVPVRADRAETLSGAVEAIAALFVMYYNLDADINDKRDERRVAIGIDRVFEYGKN